MSVWECECVRQISPQHPHQTQCHDSRIKVVFTDKVWFELWRISAKAKLPPPDVASICLGEDPSWTDLLPQFSTPGMCTALRDARQGKAHNRCILVTWRRHKDFFYSSFSLWHACPWWRVEAPSRPGGELATLKHWYTAPLKTTPHTPHHPAFQDCTPACWGGIGGCPAQQNVQNSFFFFFSRGQYPDEWLGHIYPHTSRLGKAKWEDLDRAIPGRQTAETGYDLHK